MYSNELLLWGNHNERAFPLLLIALIKTDQPLKAAQLYNQNQALNQFQFPRICGDELDILFHSVVRGTRFWKMLARYFLIKNIDNKSTIDCQKVPFIHALRLCQKLDVQCNSLVCGFYCGIVRKDLGEVLLNHTKDMENDILFVAGYISALTLTNNTFTRDIQLEKFYLLLKYSDISHQVLDTAFNSIIISLYEMQEDSVAQIVLKKQSNLNQIPSTQIFNKRLQATPKGSIYQQNNLFQKMEASGNPPTRTTYIQMLKSSLYGKSNDIQFHFKQLARLNINLDKEILTTLMRALIHSGNIDQALHVFETQFKKYDLETDIVSYGCIIGGLSKANKCIEAGNMIESMIEEGLEPNLYILNPFFRALLQSGGEDEAYSIMRSLNDRIVETFGNRINGLFLNEECELENCHVITITILFQYYRYSKEEIKMDNLMKRVEKYEIKIDKILYTSWAAFYLQKGDLDSALELLHKIQIAGIQFDISLYTLLTRAYMDNGNLERAISVLNHMAESHVIPDEMYYKRFLTLMIENTQGFRHQEAIETGDQSWNTQFIILLTHMNKNGYHSGVLQGFAKLRSLGLPIPVNLLNSEYDFAKSQTKRNISFLAILTLESGGLINEQELNEIHAVLALRREIRGSIELACCQYVQNPTTNSITSLYGLLDNLINDMNRSSYLLEIQNPYIGRLKNVKEISDSDLYTPFNALERIISFWILLFDSPIILTDDVTLKVLDSVRWFGSEGVLIIKDKLESLDKEESKEIKDALSDILGVIDGEKRSEKQ